MAYLDLAAFTNLSVMPIEAIDAIEDVSPGWVDAQLAMWSAKIDARLGKRYSVPFDAPAPLAVQGWLSDIVTHRAYLRRGVDPSDLQVVDIKAAADLAWAEIKEAADSQDGLFELPLRSDTTATGIVKTTTLSYTEASPYVGFTVQADAGRTEDANRGGTYG